MKKFFPLLFLIFIFQFAKSQEVPQPCIDVTPTSLTITQNAIKSSSIPTDWKTISHVLKDNDDEYERPFGSIIPQSVKDYWKTNKSHLKYTNQSLLPIVDWSINDSPVKDQGICGGCWAFAPTALVENIGNQNDLSEQVLISCIPNNDCGGGWHKNAFTYIRDNGIPAETCYPFTQTNGNCSSKCSNPAFLEKLTTITELWGESFTANDMKVALQTGPIAVCMLVPDDNTFSGSPGYQDGTYDYTGGPISSVRGHVVLVVGYNDAEQCFKVKNSWGPNWGEGGYFRMAYNEVTDYTEFGSYAIAISGVYTISNAGSNTFTIENCGSGNLTINSITSSKTWLTFSPSSIPMNISAGDSQTITVSVNWSLVTGSTDNATITILSNDPDEPSITVQVTAVPLSCTTPTAPAIGPITAPTCTLATGSVFLYDLPAVGTWTLTRTPGEATTTGTGTGSTITGLATGTYTFTVTNASGCVSAASDNIIINAQPITPSSPSIGLITQPTCTLATGSVFLYDLPATGTWTLTRTPGGATTTGTGTGSTITGLASGTYTFTVTNASGCVSNASDNVIINAQPITPAAPIIGPITQPTCTLATGSVFLYNLPATGTWTLTRTPGGATTTGTGTGSTITGLASGTYTFTGTNASGCISNASDNVIINAQPIALSAPSVGPITQPTSTLATGSVFLYDLPAIGAWTLTRTPGEATTTGTGTGSTITGLATGTYTFTVTNASECNSAASNNVIINAVPTGIDLAEYNKTITVYPNPFSNELIIEIQENNERVNFDILNSIGQVVYKSSLFERAVVQTTGFAPGVYLIKLENGKTFEFKKIIKE